MYAVLVLVLCVRARARVSCARVGACECERLTYTEGGLPRIHGASISLIIARCLRSGASHMIEPILQQRRRMIRIEKKQTRCHPCLRIGKHVSVIAALIVA